MLFRLTQLASTILLVFGLTVGMTVAQDRATRGTGLEWSGKIGVIIERLPDDAKEFGLSRDVIRTRTELLLRKSGIEIKNKSSGYLYVKVGMTESAFSIIASFERIVYYRHKGKKYAKYAKTWQDGGVGLAPKGDESHIMDSLDQILNSFLNKYLAANE